VFIETTCFDPRGSSSGQIHVRHLKAVYIAFCEYSDLNSQIHYIIPLCVTIVKILYKASGDVIVYEGVSKIFRTDAVKIKNLTTKRVWKLPTSTQLRATWHTDSLYMVVLPSTGASRYHNCCVDRGTSPEYFGNTFVCCRYSWLEDVKFSVVMCKRGSNFLIKL
jgi:hypothetical protein